MDAPLRHIDHGLGLWRYAGRIEVLCPRCQRPGRVQRARRENGEGEARFACAGCGLGAVAASCCGLRAAQDWFGPVRLYGRRPCGYCGHQWVGVNRVCERRPAHLPLRASARCPVCKRDSQVDLQIQPHRGGEPRDPHLGLPLRLVEPTRHGLLWAYNAEHLDELRRYVAATQRERTRESGNASMISRLPTWMKQARHRAAVLKALERIAARLGEDDSDAGARRERQYGPVRDRRPPPRPERG